MLTPSLFTVFALICAGVAAFFAADARRYAAKCENHANRLRGMLARIPAVEAHSDGVEKQLSKLRGTFYAFKAAIEDGPAELFRQDEFSQRERGIARPNSGDNEPAFCANYGQAQIEGPRSEAASCECGYCVEMRERRAEFRARAVPRTVGKPSSPQ